MAVRGDRHEDDASWQAVALIDSVLRGLCPEERVAVLAYVMAGWDHDIGTELDRCVPFSLFETDE